MEMIIKIIYNKREILLEGASMAVSEGDETSTRTSKHLIIFYFSAAVEGLGSRTKQSVNNTV